MNLIAYGTMWFVLQRSVNRVPARFFASSHAFLFFIGLVAAASNRAASYPAGRMCGSLRRAGLIPPTFARKPPPLWGGAFKVILGALGGLGVLVALDVLTITQSPIQTYSYGVVEYALTVNPVFVVAAPNMPEQVPPHCGVTEQKA